MYSVAIIVDRNYGSRIADMAIKQDLWVIDSTQNRAAVESLWQQESIRQKDPITIFRIPAVLDTKEAWEKLIANVDLHHGALSHDPPLSRLEIIGDTIAPMTVEVLMEFGYVITEQSQDRIVAQKSAA